MSKGDKTGKTGSYKQPANHPGDNQKNKKDFPQGS